MVHPMCQPATPRSRSSCNPSRHYRGSVAASSVTFDFSLNNQTKLGATPSRGWLAGFSMPTPFLHSVLGEKNMIICFPMHRNLEGMPTDLWAKWGGHRRQIPFFSNRSSPYSINWLYISHRWRPTSSTPSGNVLKIDVVVTVDDDASSRAFPRGQSNPTKESESAMCNCTLTLDCRWCVPSRLVWNQHQLGGLVSVDAFRWGLVFVRFPDIFQIHFYLPFIELERGGSQFALWGQCPKKFYEMKLNQTLIFLVHSKTFIVQELYSSSITRHSRKWQSTSSICA